LSKNLKSENPAKAKNKLPEKVFYVWNYLEWGGAQVYFFGLMKKMRETADVKTILPVGSSSQLLQFLDNLQIPYEFLDSATDVKPAPTLKRKLERHWNKLRSEFSMLKYLNRLDLKNSAVHIELAPWQSLLALLWLCRRAQVFITLHNSILPIPTHRNILWRAKFAILSRVENFHIFPSNQNAKESLKSLVPKKFFDGMHVTYTNINPLEIDEALRAQIDKNELCERFNLPADKFLVFCVGQFIDRKGRWVFLEAAKKLI
jgi:glycosyltransferase involved in cell wall biosynthesis